jgi:hypothetical protein
MKKILFILMLFLYSVYPCTGQEFSNLKETESLLKKFHNNYPDLTRLESIAKTPGGRDVWVLTVGKGDTDNHPGLAIVSGVDGRYISGPSLVLKFAESLLSASESDSIRNLLDSVSFYIVPNVSPDATEQYFSLLKYERCANEKITDDDRDGRINEDPYEDLNGDGLITEIRIKDPTGDWKIHPEDARVMVKADKKKAEKGEYIVITEGTDNDLDNQFNEDGPGGICFNQNMPFKFDHFKPGAGEFPVSEPESRGLLDFLYKQWNIYCVFTFGPADNLSEPYPYDENKATARIIDGMLEKDVILNEMVSEKFNDLTGRKKHARLTLFDGGFLQWAYFHYGRQSFGTPAFYIPEIRIKKDSVESRTENEKYNPEVNFLKWADSLLTDPFFVAWEPLEHPDFPGKEAEIGGIHPFRMINPPVQMLDSLAETHNRFILWLAFLRPAVEILDLRSTDLGNQVYRLELDLYNRGIFPAMSGIGEKTRWVKKPKISLEMMDDQDLLSGKKITLLDQLEGDSGTHLTWLVRGKGRISFEIGSPQTGIITESIELK